MNWIFASLPLLIFMVATWWVSGYVVVRKLFRVQDGVSVFALSMPCGMLTYLLCVNAISYVVFLPNTVWVVNIAFWVLSLWLVSRPAAPLIWEIGYRRRVLLAIGSVFLLIFIFLLVAREIWGDTPGHATMVQLLANGQFPMRFQCNPEELAAYQYGGNLLAAASVVTTGIPPWNGLNVVAACSVFSVASMAFLLAWRRTKSTIAGLLGVFMIFTISHFVWLFLPLTNGGLASQLSGFASASDLPEAISTVLVNPWEYAVTTPGILTPNYAHAFRTISWGFGPFVILLFLALVETPFHKRWLKSLALAYVLGTVSLLQPASLILMAVGLAAFVVFRLLFPKRFPAPDFNPWIVVAVGILIAIVQGGVITDGVQSALNGAANRTTTFALKPFTLPSCETGVNTAECIVLSVGNVGIAPWLLLVIGWRAFRRRNDVVQIILVSGAVVSYILPSFISYGYGEWNFLRVITFASWALAPFIAVLFYQLFSSRQVVKVAIGVVAIFLASYSGTITSWVIIDGRWIGDTATLDFSGMVHKVDQDMMIEAGKLPLDALIFDASTCSAVTSSRPGYLFGRYARSALDRNNYSAHPEGFDPILANPNVEALRQYGYTHVYLDTFWYSAMSPAAQQSLRTENFETLAERGNADDFRVLLRVCSADETCTPQYTVLPEAEVPPDSS